MRVGICQLSVGPDAAKNLPATLDVVGRAADAGADVICTPEVTGFIATDRDQTARQVVDEADDPTLQALRDTAKDRGVWIAVGSLAVRGPDRFANRSFLIDPTGTITARYDKIHMFDVAVSEAETYRESKRYAPGKRAVLAQTPIAKLGLTICYDLRFPHLFRDLAKAGAEVLLVPSAFSPATGPAHWETLLRARAIETGSFVVAAAQTGNHVTGARPRSTHGHSLVVSPWGEVLLDMGTDPGVALVDLDLQEVAQARQRIPALDHDRPYSGP